MGRRPGKTKATEETVEAPKSKRPVYEDYYQCKCSIEWTLPCLAGMPDLQKEKLVFERDAEGNIVFPAKHWRAIFGETMRLVDSTIYSTAKNYIYVEPAILPKSEIGGKIKDMALPVGDRGLSTHESLPAGTKASFSFLVPRSILPPEKFQKLLEMAGTYIGFSPAKHKMGYGRFKVIEFSAE